MICNIFLVIEQFERLLHLYVPIINEQKHRDFQIKVIRNIYKYSQNLVKMFPKQSLF